MANYTLCVVTKTRGRLNSAGAWRYFLSLKDLLITQDRVCWRFLSGLSKFSLITALERFQFGMVGFQSQTTELQAKLKGVLRGVSQFLHCSFVVSI